MRGIMDTNYRFIQKENTFLRFVNSTNINLFTSLLGTYTLLAEENAFLTSVAKIQNKVKHEVQKGNKQ